MSVFRPSAHALITGGASGVGYAVAQLCLKHSMRVSIVDFNQSSLEMARKNLSGNVTCIHADVSSRKDWTSIREQVGKDVDFLMLNAGISGKGTWGDEDYFNKILATNLGGVINGLNAYVPSFKERRGKEPSAIVITGSKQGITNPPGNPAYNASKAAVKTLAEHLSYDLKDTSIGVHLLVPGWTFTGLVRTPNFSYSSPFTIILTHFIHVPPLLTHTRVGTRPAQTNPSQKVHGQATKSQTTCTPRCRTKSSTSCAQTIKSRRKLTRSGCCGVWGTLSMKDRR